MNPVIAMQEEILFPGKILNLHLVPTEKVMSVERHLASDEALIAIPQKTLTNRALSPEDLAGCGCIAEIIKVVRLGDGTLQVLLEGKERVRINKVERDDDIGFVASFSPLEEFVNDQENLDRIMVLLHHEFQSLIQIDSTLPQRLGTLPNLLEDPARVIDAIVSTLSLPKSVAIRLLEEPSIDRRAEDALYATGQEKSFRALATKVEKRINNEINQQNRKYFIKKQIQVLQQELDEQVWSPNNELISLYERLKSLPLSEENHEEVRREFSRLQQMQMESSEYATTRSWLNWIEKMPWNRLSDEHLTIEALKRELNREHYGLEKIKDRIIEYAAVRIRQPSHYGTTLCFVGPPGVGKTSLARSIARAMNRKLQIFSLGGVKDEAEIRGHRRTYIGALPGKIITAIRRSKVKNPVIVLDEIDKIGKDYRGDPASALLEVLDPVQQREFVDHYLDVSFDLSDVFFICTANTLDTIPPALRDRLEIISLTSYSVEEKQQIVRQHLLPLQQKKHGLDDVEVNISNEVIIKLIDEYTNEAGVRGVEREIASICRKISRQVVESGQFDFVLTTREQLYHLLGPPKVKKPKYHHPLPYGVCTALAWTPFGGEILFIETLIFAGSGKLKLTGKIGEIMKESAQAAVSFVQYRANSLLPTDIDFAKIDIHIHFPDGATPKDGPSAGLASVISLLSALRKEPVKSALAMTGELTLRGQITPVGGIKEKCLAAKRVGINTLLIPAENEIDLQEISEKVRASTTFITVKTVDEALKHCFNL